MEGRKPAQKESPVRKLLYFSLLLAASSASALAQTSVVEMEAVGDKGTVDKTTQTEDVKFHDDSYQRMTVPVLLSGKGPYRFLVDTGADRTAISREVAAKLNLSRHTVHVYVKSLYRHYQVSSRGELLARWVRQ